MNKNKFYWLWTLRPHDTEVRTEEDLIGPGAAPGTVPTDLEQSTGLERLEILGKMEGVDVFDMRPLDASRLGTTLLCLWGEHGGMESLTVYYRHCRQPYHGPVCWRWAICRLHRLPGRFPYCYLARRMCFPPFLDSMPMRFLYIGEFELNESFD